MTSLRQPFQEPLRQTLFRTVTIAVVVGGTVALLTRRGSLWPLATLLVLWPSFGGHWIEVLFLNWVRPRVSPSPFVQTAARVLVWFVGGCLLLLGMRLTASALIQWRSPLWLTWWLGGVAFVGVELLMHLFIQLRGQPSFYNGRG